MWHTTNKKNDVARMKTASAKAFSIVLPALGSLLFMISMVTPNASAAGVAGTWVSAVSGEGYVMEGAIATSPYTWHYDVRMTLEQSGTYVYGSETITVRTVDNNPGYSGWPAYPYPMGESFTYDVDGYFDGTTFEMTVYASGYAYDFTLTVNGNSMTGSGTFDSAGVTMLGVYDLKKESGFGGFTLTRLSGMAPIVSAGVITVAIVSLVVVSTPLRIPQSPQGTVPSPPGYQPSAQSTLEVPASPISADGTVPVGGIGLHYPAPSPSGPPLSPREHFSKTSQEPPRCPIHGDVALVAHYSKTDGSDPGTWFCPRCSGYPWGKV